MGSEPSARQRFVEAMNQRMRDIRDGDYCYHKSSVRQAVEAFADAECKMRIRIEKDSHIDGKPMKVHDHAICCAALLKEIGL